MRRSIALLVVFFTVVGTAVESASLLAHFAPLLLLGPGAPATAFKPEQLQGAAYVSLRLFETGFAAALVFFGFYCLVLGYLTARSTFMPRIIGLLLAIEGLCYLANSFAGFLAPGLADRVFAYVTISGVAEVLLCLWLLVAGVNPERWHEQAAAASEWPTPGALPT